MKRRLFYAWIKVLKFLGYRDRAQALAVHRLLVTMRPHVREAIRAYNRFAAAVIAAAASMSRHLDEHVENGDGKLWAAWRWHE